MSSKRAVIVATGPSLTIEDVYLLHDFRGEVYTVNDAYKWATWCDVVYACDEEWWDTYIEDVQFQTIAEHWTTCDAAAQKYGLKHIPGQHFDAARKRFDASGQGIIYGGNSGFQAINLAYARGAREVILLGFDMGHAVGGQSHFFGDHPQHLIKPSPYSSWITHFNMAAPEMIKAGLTVRNASRHTALACFERVDLKDVL